MSAEISGREVAYRLFAGEYDDATLSHAESDDERAPNYVVTPTGARVNRLFVVGTLTEVSRVNEEMVRARVVDPTGAFVVYAGQYQPEALAFLESAEPPEFVAVTGKARTFEPDDGDRIYTSVRPESIAVVDAATRDRWVVTTAERTDERIAAIAAAATEDARGDDLGHLLAERGVEAGLASGIPLALAHYGTTPDYLGGLSELAGDAVRVIAGEREEVSPFEIAPNGSGETGVSYEELAGGPAKGSDEAPMGEVEGTESEPTTGAETVGAETTDAASDVEESSPETDAASATDSGVSDTAPTPGTDAASTADAETAETETSGTETTDSETTEAETVDAETNEPETADTASDSTEDEPEVESEPEPTAESTEAESTQDSGVATSDEFDTDLDTTDTSDEEVVADSADTEAADAEAGMYEMDDDERAEIEEEFGAEFTTGGDVEAPGEAGIETPEPESEPDSEPEDSLGDFDAGGGLESASGSEPAESADPEDADDAGEEDADEGDEEEAEIDLESLAVETMQELDDGDGADREAVVERVASEAGVDESAVESAIDGALMSGRCYEPADGTLKSI